MPSEMQTVRHPAAQPGTEARPYPVPVESPLAELPFEELAPGALAQKFQNGALAVIVHGNDASFQVWQDLMNNPGEVLPWRAPLLDIARNLVDGPTVGDQLGDMFYYRPNNLTYIARKFEILHERASRRTEVHPPLFIQGHEKFQVGEDTIQRIIDISATIMASLTPKGCTLPDHKTVVHRLKYQSWARDNKRLYQLSNHAVGKWAQLGSRLDARREQALGPLYGKGISDLFALFSLVPPLRPLMDFINNKMKAHDYLHATPRGEQIIGKPHHDARYYSALSSHRHTVSTEILVGRSWMPLPMEPNTLVILPGLQAKSLGVQPTLHRVIQLDDPDAGAHDEDDMLNTTLLIGAK